MPDLKDSEGRLDPNKFYKYLADGKEKDILIYENWGAEKRKKYLVEWIEYCKKKFETLLNIEIDIDTAVNHPESYADLLDAIYYTYEASATIDNHVQP